MSTAGKDYLSAQGGNALVVDHLPKAPVQQILYRYFPSGASMQVQSARMLERILQTPEGQRWNRIGRPSLSRVKGMEGRLFSYETFLPTEEGQRWLDKEEKLFKIKQVVLPVLRVSPVVIALLALAFYATHSLHLKNYTDLRDLILEQSEASCLTSVENCSFDGKPHSYYDDERVFLNKSVRWPVVGQVWKDSITIANTHNLQDGVRCGVPLRVSVASGFSRGATPTMYVRTMTFLCREGQKLAP